MQSTIHGSRMMINESVLDLIGNTPVVDVSNLSPNPRVRLIAKLEGQNPFGSVKDRIAKSMIEQAIADGSLKPGQRIMEPSSGNTGIALAAIAAVKGNPITILMPDSVSIERRQMLEVFGAEIILTPGPKDQMVRCVVLKRCLQNTQSGVSCINIKMMQTQMRITKRLVQKFGVTFQK